MCLRLFTVWGGGGRPVLEAQVTKRKNIFLFTMSIISIIIPSLLPTEALGDGAVAQLGGGCRIGKPAFVPESLALLVTVFAQCRRPHLRAWAGGYLE